MNWQGVADRDIYNNTKQCLENMNADWNSTPDVWNAWTPNNTQTSQPRLGNATHNYQLPNSYMVEDGSYSVSYTHLDVYQRQVYILCQNMFYNRKTGL